MRTYIKCLSADFGLENDWAALDSVEGRSVSVAKARVENLCHGQAAEQRMLYTRETRNGLGDSVARLEDP